MPGGVALMRIGGAIWTIGRPTGCSTATSMSRAATWGSLNRSPGWLTGPQGTLPPMAAMTSALVSVAAHSVNAAMISSRWWYRARRVRVSSAQAHSGRPIATASSRQWLSVGAPMAMAPSTVSKMSNGTMYWFLLPLGGVSGWPITL